jgi:hypothetical protein
MFVGVLGHPGVTVIIGGDHGWGRETRVNRASVGFEFRVVLIRFAMPHRIAIGNANVVLVALGVLLEGVAT